MMAIPTLIVAIIMGSTIIHMAGENLVSSLSTASLLSTPEWSKSPEPPRALSPLNFPPKPVESTPEDISIEYLPEFSPVPHELAPRDFNLTRQRTFIPTPDLPSAEVSAREKVIAHIGGESRYRALEDDMEEAFASAQQSLESRGISLNSLDIFAVADLTKPSYVRRLTLLHPKTGEATRHLVAHGTRTGKLNATKFSNRSGSHQSSPGLYQIGKKYRGSHGESLRLHGLDEGINDLAYRRAIVLHSAWYVSYNAMVKNLRKEGVPRIGCSHGCPAVPQHDLDLILEYLVPGSYLYIYAGE